MLISVNMRFMQWNWEQICTPLPIMGVTINTVPLHPAVKIFIYLLIAVVLVVGTAILIARKNNLKNAVEKSVVIAFFISGLAYAFHADIGWTQWLAADFRSYGGLETEQKMLRMNGGLYDFARRAEQILPDTFQIYSPDTALLWRSEYFLLPKRKREQAQFILVVGDKGARYDPVKREFSRNDAKIENVDMVLPYAQDAYILKRKND